MAYINDKFITNNKSMIAKIYNLKYNIAVIWDKINNEILIGVKQ